MILSPLYNKPNHVLERQKALQNDHRLIMQRLPRSQLYLGIFSVGFTAGMVGTAWGIYSLLKGKPASE